MEAPVISQLRPRLSTCRHVGPCTVLLEGLLEPFILSNHTNTHRFFCVSLGMEASGLFMLNEWSTPAPGPIALQHVQDTSLF